MKLLSTLMPLLLSAFFAQAQSNAVMLLWPQGAPGATGDADRDKPTLTESLHFVQQTASQILSAISPGE